MMSWAASRQVPCLGSLSYTSLLPCCRFPAREMTCGVRPPARTGGNWSVERGGIGGTSSLMWSASGHERHPWAPWIWVVSSLLNRTLCANPVPSWDFRRLPHPVLSRPSPGWVGLAEDRGQLPAHGSLKVLAFGTRGALPFAVPRAAGRELDQPAGKTPVDEIARVRVSLSRFAPRQFP